VAISTIMAILDLIINFKIGHAAPNEISNATLKTSVAKLYAEYGVAKVTCHNCICLL
jgi:hypothetical protein